MAAVAALLSRIKSKALETLGGAERVNGFFRRAAHVWRYRALAPATTLELFPSKSSMVTRPSRT